MSEAGSIGRIAQSLECWRVSLARTFRPRRYGPPCDRHLFSRRPGPWIVLAAFIATIVICMIWFDAPVIEATLEWARANPTAAYGFKQLTRLGSSGWVLAFTGFAGLVISTVAWGRLNRRQMVRYANLHSDLAFVFWSVAASGVAGWLLKNAIGRGRPKVFDELGHLHFEFLAFSSSFASFPSGHSATFGALGMSLCLLLPRYRWLWMTIAVLGGFSRVAVGAHYLSDIAAGLAFGAGVAWFSARWLAQRGLIFRFDDSAIPKRVRPRRAYRRAARPRSISAIRSSASSRPT